MIFTDKLDIKETIITLLSEGPVDSLVLLEKIKAQKMVTKQGFYKATRELINEEVITKNKQKILLSPVWITKLQQFIREVEGSSTSHVSQEIIRLEEGDSMVFRFKSIVELYLLWGHYFLIFCKKTDSPVIFFNSHNFWILLRPDIENEIYQWTKDENKEVYTVGLYNTKLLKPRACKIFIKKK